MHAGVHARGSGPEAQLSVIKQRAQLCTLAAQLCQLDLQLG
jgi:hypothetical protein